MIMIIFTIVWALLTLFMHLKKLHFFKFFIGSIGGFVVFMYLGREFLNEPLIDLTLKILSSLFAFSESILIFPSSNAVTVLSGQDRLSYFLTFECSGFVEMIIFLNVYVFFSLKIGFFKRIFTMIFGIIYLLIANIIRLTIMSYIVVLFGVESYFVAHVLISRLVFMLFNIILYYYTLTLPHVKRQNVSSYKSAV